MAGVGAQVGQEHVPVGVRVEGLALLEVVLAIVVADLALVVDTLGEPGLKE